MPFLNTNLSSLSIDRTQNNVFWTEFPKNVGVVSATYLDRWSREPSARILADHYQNYPYQTGSPRH